MQTHLQDISNGRDASAGDISRRLVHEMNNLLDALGRYVGLLAAQTDEADNVAAEYARGARTAIARLGALINSIHENDGGERVPLEHLLEQAITVMKPRADAQHVTISQRLDAAVAQEPMATELFHVFCNVIKNALDASTAGGSVCILAAPADGSVVVECTDTGSGLTPQQAERAFEAFYTTKPPGEGSGLGLTICQEIISHHGGQISIACVSGGGAAVRIVLPTVEASKAESTT